MKHGLSHALALIGLGLATFAVTPAHAQTTAPGPYYATPSWDQQVPASTRFIVLSNWNSEAVLDRETGLVWQRTPGGSTGGVEVQYEGATHLCAQAKTGGRFGWRLPALEEILSLGDPSVVSVDPVAGLPPGHPFLSFPVFRRFWTSTTRTIDSNLAWAVSLSTQGLPGLPGSCCGITPGMPKSESFLMRHWCVRGGGPVQLN